MSSESAPGRATGPGEKVPPVSEKSDAQSVVLSPSYLQPLARLCVDANGVGALLDISPRHVRMLDTTGALPRGFTLGRCKRWSVDELRAWLVAGCPCREGWEAMRAEGGTR